MVFKVSVAQFNIVLGKYQANFEKVSSMIDTAAREGSDLILLPELWLGGYDYRNFENYQKESSLLLKEIQEISAARNIAICGSYPVNRGGQVFNSLIYQDPNGSRQSYEKLHLFSPIQEDKFFEKGTLPVIINTGGGKAGLAICYDLRFPELFRKYTLEGAQIILLCAEWPLKRIEHWITLLKARAIENQVFVVACNAVGKTGREIMGGTSMVIDPWGDCLIQADSESEQVLTAEIILDKVLEARKTIPMFSTRRTDIYG